MKIQRWTNPISVKVNLDKLKRITKQNNGVNSLIETEGGINMATATFDKTITLNSISAEKLINKIEYDKNNPLNFPNIDVQKELRESAKALKRLLSR